MSDCFAVEVNRQVIGVAVRVAGGFRFYSSQADFLHLEGRVFPRARALERCVKALSEEQSKQVPQ